MWTLADTGVGQLTKILENAVQTTYVTSIIKESYAVTIIDGTTRTITPSEMK